MIWFTCNIFFSFLLSSLVYNSIIYAKNELKVGKEEEEKTEQTTTTTHRYLFLSQIAHSNYTMLTICTPQQMLQI